MSELADCHKVWSISRWMISRNQRRFSTYALGYMKAEQFSDAIDYYLKSWETDKSKYAVLSNLGYCYERLKDWKEAEKYYLQYLKYSKPGSGGYKYVEESLEYVRRQLLMAE
ncbi:MAG: tetratricopeptide repeat protein [Candidatus Cryptobacteroides sp.]